MKEKKLLKNCFIYTFLFGIAAHAYGFFNFTISHDSLEALYSGAAETEWKISIGRVFVPAYRWLTRGFLTSPWMIGLLAMIWIALAVYLLLRLFEKEDVGFTVLAAGIMTVNPIVTALTATFLHDLDVDMFALFLMTAAVYLWKKSRWGVLAGIPMIAVGLGLYQSYLSVAIALIMIVCMMWLLDGKSAGAVLKKGLSGMIMLIAGGGVYLISMRAICGGMGIAVSDSYNSISRLGAAGTSAADMFWYVVKAYYYWLMYFLNPASVGQTWVAAAANIIVLLCLAGIILTSIFSKKIKTAEKILLITLGGALPLGMNISAVLSKGMLHGLMMYGFCMIYILTLLVAEWNIKNSSEKHRKTAKYARTVIIAGVAFIIWNGFPMANAAYLKKDLERQQTHSLMTRVAERMESQEGYIRGETTVAFVGKIDMPEMPGFEAFEGDGRTSGVQGLTANDQIKNYRDYEEYFQYVLNIPIDLCTEEQRSALWEMQEVKAMPVFPDEGCMQTVDGILVVKMGERY